MYVQGQQDQHLVTDYSYCMVEVWNQGEWMFYANMGIQKYDSFQLMHLIHRVHSYQLKLFIPAMYLYTRVKVQKLSIQFMCFSIEYLV